jgi:hypothetical protein
LGDEPRKAATGIAELVMGERGESHDLRFGDGAVADGVEKPLRLRVVGDERP